MGSVELHCRCPDPLVIGDLVHRVHSCPRCISTALEWFGHQLDLFEEGEIVSVSAVLASECGRGAIRVIEVVSSDDLPF